MALVRSRTVVVTATVVSDEPAHVVRAVEVLARAAAGLSLDGMNVEVSAMRPCEDEDEESTP